MASWRVMAGSLIGLILVSLFVVRPLAIWLSLSGSDADTFTRLFSAGSGHVGWPQPCLR